MKKSETVNNIDTNKMAQVINCYSAPLRLALAWQERSVETDSINRISKTSEARKLFKQAKSPNRQAMIALKWFSVCLSVSELADANKIVHSAMSDSYNDRYITTNYNERLVSLLRAEIPTMTVEKVFEYWTDCSNLDFEEYSIADKVLFDGVCVLAESGKTTDPVKFVVENWKGTSSSYHRFEIFSRVMQHMTPDQALETLKVLAEHTDIDTRRYGYESLRFLIVKAALLFKRSSVNQNS